MFLCRFCTQCNHTQRFLRKTEALTTFCRETLCAGEYSLNTYIHTYFIGSSPRGFSESKIDDAVNLNYGPDKIMPKILKLSAPCLAIHLTKLLYLCISNSTWPAECKLSHVTPVFKKDATSVSNYRPAIQQIP